VSIQTLIPTITDRTTLNQVFQAIKDLSTELEKEGFVHGNLKATNVFVTHMPAKDNYKLKLVLSDPFVFPSDNPSFV
jgi:hypothetical protein